MDDTVYRKDVIDTMEKIMADHPIDGYEDECQLVNAMKSLPSADPEPSQLAKDIARILENDQDMRVILKNAETKIVRCRDCKHKPSGDGMNHHITFPDGRCPCQCDDYWYSWIPDDDWFCGNAERREDGQTT